MAKILPIKRNETPNGPTLCVNCEHFANLEPGTPRADVWYNHLCLAHPLPKKIDFYDSQEKPYNINDLGMEILSHHAYKNCRDINDGKCAKFKPKENKKLP